MSVETLVGEEVFDVSELVVDHEGEHSHLGGTALVQFHGTLLQLGLIIKGIPTKVQGAVAEVADVFVARAFNVLHDGEFQKANKGGDLQGTSDRDGEGGIPSVAKVRELGARVVNVTRQVDAGGVDEVANNTEHADASVLDFDVSEAIELFLVTVSDKAKGIKEAQRRLGTCANRAMTGPLSVRSIDHFVKSIPPLSRTEFALKGIEGGGADGLLGGRGKGSSRGDEGGEDEFHGGGV
jgi:hypothetical protein